MLGYDTSDDQRPVLWLRGHPVYAAHLLTAFFVLSLVVTTLLMQPAPQVLALLSFRSDAVLRGEVWRVATYGLVNPPGLWIAVEMLMLAWFGREIERFFGRRAFLTLYAGLYFLPPLLGTALGFWRPTAFAGEASSFGLFIAFAALYPDAMMLFNLLAKWVAAILVGIYTLTALGAQDWTRLLSLWAIVGFAYVFVRQLQGRVSLPRFTVARARSAPDPRPAAAVKARAEDSLKDVDALLDKIAASGLGSLTAKERAQLNAARDRLRRRENGR